MYCNVTSIEIKGLIVSYFPWNVNTTEKEVVVTMDASEHSMSVIP